MSIVPKETIEVIAQSIGMAALSPEVALALAPDVEYRLREVMQEAIKCMRHSKRTVLTPADVDSALTLRNIEPIYGFASGDPLRFKRAVGHKDLFYIDDKELDFKDVIEAPLPKAPLDTTVAVHWLAIEGVQPAIPENAPVEALVAPLESKRSDHIKDDGVSVDIKLPIKHVLSRELQLYFEKITELTLMKSDTVLFKEALKSLATDSGIHPLVPYFSYFIADEVTRSLSDLSLLFALMRILGSLLQNPHIHIEPYLHQMMPSIVTCIVAKRLGNQHTDNHWGLRDFSAHLSALICQRYAHVYHSLRSRLTKTLISTFLEPTKALTQHYGAIQGISALGSNEVRLSILPNLEPYLQHLEPEMLPEKQKNEIKRKEAWRVYGALQLAAGKCLYERLKPFPSLLTPSVRSFSRSSGRDSAYLQNKRKMSSNLSLLHPSPSKKLAADGAAAPTFSATTSGNTQTRLSSEGFTSPSHSGTGASSSGHIANNTGALDNKIGGTESKPLIMSASLVSSDPVLLLAALFELFEDRIFAFVPRVEMAMFL